MWLTRYRRVVGAPGAMRLVLAALIARLPFGILGLALVLFVRQQGGSYATAGAVSAALALTAGLLSPLQGRLIDRIGQRRVLVPLAIAHGVLMAALVALGLEDAPDWALIACSGLAGAAIPPISPCLRPLWPLVLGGDDELVVTAYTLDSIMLEAVFVVGPAVTALAVAVASPQAALIASGAMVTAGTLWFATSPQSRDWRSARAGGERPGWALAAPGMRTLALATLPIGACFGGLEVALPAFSADHGSRAAAGVLLSLLSVGSVVAGFWYGSRTRFRGPRQAYLWLIAFLPIGFAPLAAADSILVMALLAPLAGLVIAPLATAENQLVVELAPAGTLTEAFTWPLTATVVGVSIGNLGAGAIVDASGWRLALLGVTVFAAAGALLALGRRRTLEAPPEPLVDSVIVAEHA